MENNLVTSVVTVLMAIIGVAIIAVLVSKQANTTGVINAGSSAFSSALGTALSPVTGATSSSGIGVGFGGTNEVSYM
jgi:hypothetical protein